MKIGFFTAVLSDQPIEHVARWARSANFDTLEIDVNSHIGDLAQARRVIADVRERGLEVDVLTYFGNLLDEDPAQREAIRSDVDATVDVALDTGVPYVCVFPGRDRSVSEEENYQELARYLTALTARAARGNVKIIIENWPGPDVAYLATTPAGWTHLFALVPVPNLGLNFDPSHLIWQGIDPEAALRQFADRVFLTHAKDTEIDTARLQETGYFSGKWWTYRLPGHGTLDWNRWLCVLREIGYDGIISIEHEDPDWGWEGDTSVERRQAGLMEAQRVLRQAQPR